MDDRDDYIPGVDDQEQEPPEGGSPPSPVPEKTAQEIVLDALPRATAQDLLKTVHKFGVREDDPLWIAILVILHANELVTATASAAGRVETAGKDLGDMIFTQTIKAGGELKANMDEAATTTTKAMVQQLTKGIVAAISKPFGEGVKNIEEAIGAVDSHVEKERAVILATWRKDLASAAAREARRRSLVIAAVSWGTILLTCAACITIGAGVTWGVLDMTGHLLPWGYHLLVRPNGTPYCGAFHGAYVCGVTH